MSIKHSTCNIRLLALLLLATLVSACQKENISDIGFLAVAESADNPDAKTRLVNENMVYWEPGDAITVFTDGRDTVKAVFTTSDTYNGTARTAIFRTNDDVKLPRKATFTALFPYNEHNSISSSSVKINIAEEQGYRDEESEYRQFADLSFASSACPMVAYGSSYDEQDKLVRLLFHNLCGLVRIQVRNAASGISNVKVNKLTITSTGDSPKQLSGLFTVNKYTENAPYLTAAGSVANDNKITLTLKEVPMPDNGLTFYIALPALSGTGATQYNDLELSIDAVDGDNHSLEMEKSFNVSIRRNGITMMPMINVTSWNEGGSVEPSIAGHGTAERPFLIYDVNDLVYVRNRCNANGSLNGVDLSGNNDNVKNVWFKIMRSDIILTSTNWTEGFSNFKCHMLYSATQAASRPGITNNSQVPIFNQISGTVEGITLRGGFSQTATTGVNTFFSPFCITLAAGGEIINCSLADDADFSYTGGDDPERVLAGLCVYNNGTITGCGCRGKLATKTVAGICYSNSGTVERCFAASSMQTVSSSGNTSGKAAGIVFLNNGSATVQECYMAANINMQATSWGGIVYTNNGSVTQCYIGNSGIIQSTQSIGGIVHDNTGIVDYCWNDTDLLYVDVSSSATSDAGGIGGIVHTMTGGEVRNCFMGRGVGSITSRRGAAGGVVAYLNGGAIRNCYAYTDLSQSTVRRRGTFAGEINGGEITNCYSLSSYPTDNITAFYGYIDPDLDASTTINHSYCNIPVPDPNNTDPDNPVYIVNPIPTTEPPATVNNYPALQSALNGWPNDASWPSSSKARPSKTYPDGTYRQWVENASGSKPPILSQNKEWLTTSK